MSSKRNNPKGICRLATGAIRLPPNSSSFVAETIAIDSVTEALDHYMSNPHIETQGDEV